MVASSPTTYEGLASAISLTANARALKLLEELIKSVSHTKHILHQEKLTRIKRIYFEGEHTFDMDDVIRCHVRSGELVDSGSMCKRKKATVFSKDGKIICVMAYLSSSPQASEV